MKRKTKSIPSSALTTRPAVIKHFLCKTLLKWHYSLRKKNQLFGKILNHSLLSPPFLPTKTGYFGKFFGAWAKEDYFQNFWILPLPPNGAGCVTKQSMCNCLYSQQIYVLNCRSVEELPSNRGIIFKTTLQSHTYIGLLGLSLLHISNFYLAVAGLWEAA